MRFVTVLLLYNSVIQQQTSSNKPRQRSKTKKGQGDFEIMMGLDNEQRRSLRVRSCLFFSFNKSFILPV